MRISIDNFISTFHISKRQFTNFTKVQRGKGRGGRGWAFVGTGCIKRLVARRTLSAVSVVVLAQATSTGHLLVTLFECPFVNWRSVLLVCICTVSYTHLTLPTNREV